MYFSVLGSLPPVVRISFNRITTEQGAGLATRLDCTDHLQHIEWLAEQDDVAFHEGLLDYSQAARNAITGLVDRIMLRQRAALGSAPTTGGRPDADMWNQLRGLTYAYGFCSSLIRHYTGHTPPYPFAVNTAKELLAFIAMHIPPDVLAPPSVALQKVMREYVDTLTALQKCNPDWICLSDKGTAKRIIGGISYLQAPSLYASAVLAFTNDLTLPTNVKPEAQGTLAAFCPFGHAFYTRPYDNSSKGTYYIDPCMDKGISLRGWFPRISSAFDTGEFRRAINNIIGIEALLHTHRTDAQYANAFPEADDDRKTWRAFLENNRGRLPLTLQNFLTHGKRFSAPVPDANPDSPPVDFLKLNREISAGWSEDGNAPGKTWMPFPIDWKDVYKKELVPFGRLHSPARSSVTTAPISESAPPTASPASLDAATQRPAPRIKVRAVSRSAGHGLKNGPRRAAMHISIRPAPQVSKPSSPPQATPS